MNEAIPILRFALALLLFWLPGYWWTSWLHRRANYHWTLRAALGFAWSFAVFAAVAWPFLWFRGSFHAFLSVLGVVWLIFGGVATTLRVRSAEPALPSNSASPLAPEVALPASPSVSWSALGSLVAYIATCALVIWLPHEGRAVDWGWQVLEWTIYGVALTLLLLTGCWLVLFWRRRLFPGLAFDATDDAPASHLVRSLALVFICLQALSAAALDRPDWDDCYYLAAVLDYQQADVLNAEEPTHREGFAVNAINGLLAWELWQATLCWCSGLNPMAVAHTLLPGLLVLLAYAGYWNLLAESVPRRWVALAMLGVAAYHLWGVSSHDTPANYLLTRIWQGKAALIHLAVPLIVLMLREVSRQPNEPGRWLTLVATTLFGLAASSSAVFLEVMLLVCLGIAFALTLPMKRRWKILVAAAVAALPSVLFGLLIRQSVVSDASLTVRPGPSWHWMTWFLHLGAYVEYGSAEALWLLLLPVLALVLHERHRCAYLIVFPIVLTATFANPLLADPVATHLTSYHTFFRTFWLFPVAAGLGATLALLARLFSRILESWGIRAPHQVMPLAFTTVALVLSWFMPTLYIWSERNVRPLSPDAGDHPIASNLLKMPPDLIVIADKMLEDPDVRQHRILANEHVTNYLTPYSRDFRFVQTRALYTLYMTDVAGRRAEGERRYLLTFLLWGHIPQAPTEEPIQCRHPFYPGPRFPNPRFLLDEKVVRDWLTDLNVKYLILGSSEPDTVTRRAGQVGFRPVWSGRQLTLWARDETDAGTKE